MDVHKWILHTVLVPKSHFSRTTAINYVKKHFQYKKMHEQMNFFRFRQKSPYKDGEFFTRKLTNGVELIFMRHRQK